MTFTTQGANGLDRVFVRVNATGAAAMAEAFTMDAGIRAVKLVRVTLHMSVAPTTSENFTITIDSDIGAAYDTLLYSLDLSAASTTDLVLTSDDFGDIVFINNESGSPEELDFAYTNTDTRTWGLTALFEVM